MGGQKRCTRLEAARRTSRVFLLFFCSLETSLNDCLTTRRSLRVSVVSPMNLIRWIASFRSWSWSAASTLWILSHQSFSSVTGSSPFSDDAYACPSGRNTGSGSSFSASCSMLGVMYFLNTCGFTDIVCTLNILAANSGPKASSRVAFRIRSSLSPSSVSLPSPTFSSSSSSSSSSPPFPSLASFSAFLASSSSPYSTSSSPLSSASSSPRISPL